jgi:hypothetical protein
MLDRESQVFHDFLKPYLTDCAGYLTHTADITSTSVQEQQQTLNCVVTMQSRESVFGDYRFGQEQTSSGRSVARISSLLSNLRMT